MAIRSMACGRSSTNASSRQTWTSACAYADASAGIGVRREPKRDIAITRIPLSTSPLAKAIPLIETATTAVYSQQ